MPDALHNASGNQPTPTETESTTMIAMTRTQVAAAITAAYTAAAAGGYDGPRPVRVGRVTYAVERGEPGVPGEVHTVDVSAIVRDERGRFRHVSASYECETADPESGESGYADWRYHACAADADGGR